MRESTGLQGLDAILTGIAPGDSVVWQTDSIDDYMPYVRPFVACAEADGREAVYFRFAKHQRLVPEGSRVRVHEAYPDQGFEKFITEIHERIERTGRDGYFIFDSLSELAIDCYSERMTGNFFLLTCPLLHRLGCVSYFTVIRNYHSYHAALPIAQTTQIIIDVHSHRGKRYLHPLKVDGRYSPTMFMLHAWEGDRFFPVTESTVISEVSTSGTWHGLPSASYRMVGLWDRRFIRAEDLLESYERGESSAEMVRQVFRQQITQLISRDPRMIALVEKYLSLKKIIYLWKRTIGSGMIGGKAVGMILARAILEKEPGRYGAQMENHDSFFIGSDIYYSFIVQNGCWHIRQKQKNAATLFEGIDEARERILAGEFPEYIVKRFSDMLEYYGQAPIIVRSSSLLEDDFGNAFSGKYESIFLVNSGAHERRLQKFLEAVRIIYAGTMSREALAYRAQRNVLENDEQMALLVQRVSGAKHNRLFFPQVAGVGISFNSYAWDTRIDPEAGLVRVVFGLGTRAVNRHDDDYTRVAALNAPSKRPEGNSEEIRQFTQKRIDVLDLDKDSVVTGYFMDMVRDNPEMPVDMFSSEETDGETTYRILNFDHVFSRTPFIKDMREILRLLRNAYGCHVDIEFTASFSPGGSYALNLLQCRPHLVKEGGGKVKAVPNLAGKEIILQAGSGIVGQSRATVIDRIVYVVPSRYGELAEQDRYRVARTVGRLVHGERAEAVKKVLLIGPGRWCTHEPSLGVPVTFSEISRVCAVCELDIMHEGLKPDLSMGTHFFNDMVEMNILYIGLFVGRQDNAFNEEYLMKLPNMLGELLPDSLCWADTIRVIDGTVLPDKKRIRLNADSVRQSAHVYVC